MKAWNTTHDIEPYFEPFLETVLQSVTYLVYKGQVKFDLPVIHYFCLDTPEQLLHEAFVSGPGIGKRKLQVSDLKDFGITWTDSEFMIDAANFEWYNYTFDITLLPTVEEENTWFNYTKVKIDYVRPPCEVSQSMLDDEAGGQSVELYAIRGITQKTVPITQIIASAHKAFETHRRAFCGNMVMAKLDLQNEQPFTTINFEGETLTLNPSSSAEGGLYEDTYIHFYFDDYPDREVKVKIMAEVSTCNIFDIRLAQKVLVETYLIGDPMQTVSLPNWKLPSGCGDQKPVITNATLSVVQVPEGLSAESLVTYDEAAQIFVIQHSWDLQMYEKSVLLKLSVKTDLGVEDSLELNVLYSTEGPEFD